MVFYRVLGNYLEGKRCRVYAAPFTVRLFETAQDRPENVDTVVEPDLSVVCDPEKLDEIGCKGAPDLVVEVLSPSTQRRDRLVKLNLYRQAGVREYWVVDPVNNVVEVFMLKDGVYQLHEVGTAAHSLKVAVLEDCVVDLAAVFAQ